MSNGHFTKMKVGIAAQQFREVAAVIRYLIEKSNLPPETEATAWFFELVFKWYMLMTAHHLVIALSLTDETKYEQAISTLDLALDVFRGLSIGVKKVWKPCQSGVLMSTSVVLKLHAFLLKECGYKFVFTGRHVQVCLENLFCN